MQVKAPPAQYLSTFCVYTDPVEESKVTPDKIVGTPKSSVNMKLYLGAGFPVAAQEKLKGWPMVRLTFLTGFTNTGAVNTLAVVGR